MKDRVSRRSFHMLAAAAILPFLLQGNALPAADWRFEVRYPKETRAEPYTGRVYVFFSRNREEPRTGPGWIQPDPFIARDVRDWQPGEPLVFDAARGNELLAFPVPLAEMSLAGHRAQAVVRFDADERTVGTGPGNGFSAVRTLPVAPQAGAAIALTVDRIVPEPEFRETRWTKRLEVESKLLSDFHGRPVKLRAAIALPASYHDRPKRRYPTIFEIPGFGGTHFSAIRNEPVAERNARGVEFLRVTLDPSCPLGHHVFADSANNGPFGRALVEELLPAFEARFRGIAEPTARFLTGHSSGGWSSLWVQITHPETFGGVWSTAPDPVDFRDFQRIDLYADRANMHFEPNGEPRPLARVRGRVVIRYRDFDRMEHVLGHGGQLHSFEAVFSPRGADGRPVRLWSRETGAVDPAVAEMWKKYDIRLVLEENWPTLGPQLAGKLHVITGGEDTFYLEGAVRQLKKSLADLGSDAVVEIVPGKDHSNVLSPELVERIRAEMTAAFLKRHEWE
ncbi:MAG: alpha/beta hydrolase-fold protein [Planctomycetaceae bacterium]